MLAKGTHGWLRNVLNNESMTKSAETWTVLKIRFETNGRYHTDKIFTYALRKILVFDKNYIEVCFKGLGCQYGQVIAWVRMCDKLISRLMLAKHTYLHMVLLGHIELMMRIYFWKTCYFASGVKSVTDKGQDLANFLLTRYLGSDSSDKFFGKLTCVHSLLDVVLSICPLIFHFAFRVHFGYGFSQWETTLNVKPSLIDWAHTQNDLWG